MKKIIKILMVILIVSVLTLTVVACDKTCADGEHSWGEWVTTATCTEAGEDVRTCSICGATDKRDAEALGHDWVRISTTATCFEGGTEDVKCSRCDATETRDIDALGHDFEGSYFMLAECLNGCGQTGRYAGEHVYDDVFVYEFDDERKELIEALYKEIEDALNGNGAVSNEEFVVLFDSFDEEVSYVQGQYQFARVFYDVNRDESTRADYNYISEYFNQIVEKYYKLFRLIDDSDYGSYFWEWTGWSDADIEYALAQADSYDLENQNAVDSIIDNYNILMERYVGTDEQLAELCGLYYQLVNANNNIAKSAGFENYMEYAYNSIYSRDYSPNDVSAMRDHVKATIASLFADVMNEYIPLLNAGLSKADDINFYNGLTKDNVLSAKVGTVSRLRNTIDYIGNYFKFLNNGQEGDKQINFYGAVNDLFKNGNYFTGVDEGAYTWWISALQTPIMYFGPGSYSTAFTFTHEFGHYYENLYNGSLSLSYDLDETHSQGNEMLFLAWLRENKPESVIAGFDTLELEQLYGMMVNILLSTAVDEFEQLVYTGATTYGQNEIPTIEAVITNASGEKTTIEVINYQSLFESVLARYGSTLTKYFSVQSYWSYVVFDQAGYYISYAMSALPCLELYAKAGSDGLDSARESYFKLFTFADEEQFVGVEVSGDGSTYRHIQDGVTYQQILNFCGLSGPFESELYTTISNYFANRD